MAYPSKYEIKTLLNELPRVIPNPVLKGFIKNLPLFLEFFKIFIWAGEIIILLLNYLEYNSTSKRSLIFSGICSLLGIYLKIPLLFFNINQL